MRKAEAATKQFRVGFSRVDITPAESLPMGGYIARNEPAAGTHDPLYVKAIAFRLGEASAILLSLDILHVSHTWSRRLRETISQKVGLQLENILVAATHTHSGPAVFFPIITHTEEIARYEESLFANCLTVAEKAFASAEPSVMRIGRGRSRGVVMNRRDPTTQTDDWVSLVRIENLSRKVKGHLVSFACHPTVMSPKNLDYSADLFGVAATEVEGKFKVSTCLMFNGAGGDASTRFTRREQTWGELDRLGKKLAKQIVQVSRKSKPAGVGPISAKIVVLKFPFKPILASDEAQRKLDEANYRFTHSLAEDGNKEDSLVARSLVDGASAQFFLSKLGGWEPLFGTNSAEVEIQVIRVGDLIFCGLPGEFFGSRGNSLKNVAHPKHCVVAGYANGYWGYVVPPREAAKGGYEAMMSPLDPSNEPKIIREASSLVKEIKKARVRKRAAESVRRALHSRTH